MNEEKFDEFIHEVIPQQLFHVFPSDIDDESGGRFDEVTLVGLIANNPSCLKYKSLQWFLDTFLISQEEWDRRMNKQNKNIEQTSEEKLKEILIAEIERQFLDGEMISSEDFFPSSEKELFRQIEEDDKTFYEKEKRPDNRTLAEKLHDLK